MIKIINESSDALVLDDKSKMAVASQISLNIKDEFGAIEGYNKLIDFLAMYDDQEGIDQVREIISDEKNHAEVLSQLLMKYDGNIPVAED